MAKDDKPKGPPVDPSEFDLDLEALVDIREKGLPIDGETQYCTERNYLQMQVFTDVEDQDALIEDFKKSGITGTLYANINDAKGVGLLTVSDDAEFFATTLRDYLRKSMFKDLTQRHDFTMMGRSYSIGHEMDLEDWMLKRNYRTVLDPEWPWAVWYPLKRKGPFYRLDATERGRTLMEHGLIGRAFGMEGLGRDVRLSSFGIDENDNDYLIALIGQELFPLSKLVETMRGTIQTSTYMEKMGPFFVGHVIYQSEVPEKALKK